MKLNFKKAVNDVFGLRFYWVYIFLAAVIATLSSIIQSTKGMPLHNAISNVISIFTYISTGYLLIMVNNLLHDNDLNNNDETFWQNFWNSTKKGLKCFLGTLLNTIIVFAFGALIAMVCVLTFMAITHIAITENNLFHYTSLKIILGLLALVLVVFMLFILKFLPIAFAENFSLKIMFCWRKVFKEFFFNGKAKKTLAIIGIYILIELTIFLMMFIMLFTLNLAFIYTIKTLLTNHYVLAAFLINISAVITPFLGAMAHFMLMSIIYNMLADVYKQ